MSRVVLPPTMIFDTTALGHPVPPAGAKTSYALFVRDFFAKNKPVVEKLPNGRPNLSNLASQMSSEWTSMSASDKQPYINQANESKAQYEREFEAFYDSLEPGQLREIEHILGKKIRMPGGRAKQAANKREAMGAPKKPLTAFFLFMKALRAKGTLATNDANEKLSVLEQSKAASQQWKTMDEQKRKVSRLLAPSYPRVAWGGGRYLISMADRGNSAIPR